MPVAFPVPRIDEELPAVRPSGARIGAWTTNPVCARAAKRTGAHMVYVPALNYGRGEAVVAGQLTATVEQAGYPKQCLLAMPVVDHDEVGLSREAKLDFDPWRYATSGRPVFAESLGAMQMAAEDGSPSRSARICPSRTGLRSTRLLAWVPSACGSLPSSLSTRFASCLAIHQLSWEFSSQARKSS